MRHNPDKSSPWLWGTALAVALGGLICHFYWPVVCQPDYHVLSSAGDGAKNYYTFLYHVVNDEHLLNGDDFNYPYGELVFYSDGHPALSWLLRALPFAQPHAVGILNLLLLSGLIVYGLCVSAILRRLGLPSWTAAVGALGVTMLQPQLFRMEGHLALAHCYLLPLAWYMHLLSLSPGRTWRWSIVLCLVLLYAFCTHAYLGLMLSLFLCAAWGLRMLRDGTWLGQSALPAIAQAVVPLFVFVALVRVQDTHSGRPTAPLTDSNLLASVDGLCVPHHPSLLSPLTKMWTGLEPSWESWCYLGVATMSLLLFALFRQLIAWGKRSAPLRTRIDDEAALYLGAGSIVLFAAFGFHRPLEKVLPMLQQFRGLGRLAWMFYLTASVFTFARLYQWTLCWNNRLRALGITALLVPPVLNTIEGWPYFETSSQSVSNGWTPFIRDWAKDDLRTIIELVEREHPLALMPMPFWHAGSEVYKRGDCGPAFRTIFPVSLFTRTPILAGITSRTSIPETIAQFSLLAPVSFPKPITKDLPSSGEIFLVHGGEQLDDDERQLIARSTPVLRNGQAAVFRITVEELTRCDAGALLLRYASEHTRWSKWRESLVEWPALIQPTDTSDLLFGPEIVETIERRWDQELTLADMAPGALDTSYEYALEMVFHTLDPAGVNLPIIWEHDTPGESDGTWEPMENIRAMPIIIGDRVFVSMKFKPKDPGHHNLLFIPGDRKRRIWYGLSHVYLRRSDVHIWREERAPQGILILRDNVPLNPEVLADTTAELR